MGQKRWESLLHYMVAPALEPSTRPEEGWRTPKEVKDELLAQGRDGSFLMRRENAGSKITEAGFQFLLRPVRAQVWQLLMDLVY